MRETTLKRLASWSFGDKNDLTQVECWVPQSLWWLHQLASLHLSPVPSQYCTDSSFGHILTRVASSLDSQPTFTSTAIVYWRLVLGSKLMSKEKKCSRIHWPKNLTIWLFCHSPPWVTQESIPSQQSALETFIATWLLKEDLWSSPESQWRSVAIGCFKTWEQLPSQEAFFFPAHVAHLFQGLHYWPLNAPM